MDSPRTLGCRSVTCIRNRCQYSAARNRVDGRIRPCRMADHKDKTDQVHWSLVSEQVVCQGFGTNISRDILLPTQQSHQMSCADPRHSVLDHCHSRNLRRRAFAGSLSRTRPVQKTQLQAADSSSQGCVNQSKSDADRCGPILAGSHARARAVCTPRRPWPDHGRSCAARKSAVTRRNLASCSSAE